MLKGSKVKLFTETSGYGIAVEIFVKRFGKYRSVYSMLFGEEML